ncbi:hypothetical protein ETD86_13420 [Nonomuraea turkmeniaca]|uniref:Uncharacterized protein n=1 Tax=Nonomuraea turkmeniaca TaxID=103838 RepID=A0A5S4FMG0_9ACTN|nr:hypothetical protein [Nonomuraea turkmeniaca]TMR21917.1 hypothetical protein ETD86_13420 [Nonomuraea turkmeniaca]
MMDRPDPPTAIVASTDVAAVGVLHAAHSLGVTVLDSGVKAGIQTRIASTCRCAGPATRKGSVHGRSGVWRMRTVIPRRSHRGSAHPLRAGEGLPT